MLFHSVQRKAVKFGAATLAGTTAVAALLAFAVPAQAVDFNLGTDITGSLDSTYSVGGAMRTKGRDPALVGVANGGTAFSINGDNGNLNFSKGDFVSLAARGTNELSIKGGNIQLFTRVNYFYDYINNDKTLDRTQLNKAARNLAGLKFDLLDLYVAGNFDVGDSPLSVRVGKQVLSWGESTLLELRRHSLGRGCRMSGCQYCQRACASKCGGIAGEQLPH